MDKKKIVRLPMNIFYFYAIFDNEACLLLRINGVKIIIITIIINLNLACSFLCWCIPAVTTEEFSVSMDHN